MAPKRPVPLSDEIFVPPPTAGSASLHYPAGPAPVLLGAKNPATRPQFAKYADPKHALDSPHGCGEKKHLQMSAPAEINRSPGFIQRAMAAGMHTPQLSRPGITGSMPPSPAAAQLAAHVPTPPSSGSYGAPCLYTPLQTPTPTAAREMFQTGPLLSTLPQRTYLGAAGSSVPLSIPSPPLEPPRAASGVAGYASLHSGPLTFALDHSSMQYHGLSKMTEPVTAAATTTSEDTGSATQDAPVEHGAIVVEEEDDDEDNESESDGELVTVPPHLRNPADAPRPPPGALHPSVGSDGHGTGSCKRCCFFPRGRCANGYECEFCHYDHDKRKRKSKKKKTVRGADAFLASLISNVEQPYMRPEQIALANGLLGASLHQNRTPDSAPPYVDSHSVTAYVDSQTVIASSQQQSFMPGYYQQTAPSCTSAQAMTMQSFGACPLPSSVQPMLFCNSAQHIGAAPDGQLALLANAVQGISPAAFPLAYQQRQFPIAMPNAMPSAAPAMSAPSMQGPWVNQGLEHSFPPPPPMQSPKIRQYLGRNESPPVNPPTYAGLL